MKCISCSCHLSHTHQLNNPFHSSSFVFCSVHQLHLLDMEAAHLPAAYSPLPPHARIASWDEPLQAKVGYQGTRIPIPTSPPQHGGTDDTTVNASARSGKRAARTVEDSDKASSSRSRTAATSDKRTKLERSALTVVDASTASLVHSPQADHQENDAKTARTALDGAATEPSASVSPPTPQLLASTSRKRKVISAQAAGPSVGPAPEGPSSSIHRYSGPPQTASIPHSMHGRRTGGSLGTYALEVPRKLFPSRTSKRGYIIASRLGSLGYWREGMGTESLISEDADPTGGISVGDALFSNADRLAVIAYRSESSHPTHRPAASMHLIQLDDAKHPQCFKRRAIAPEPYHDVTGLSALTWGPRNATGLLVAAAESREHRLQIWSIDPRHDSDEGSQTNLKTVWSPHSKTIRTILWRSDVNRIVTGGADGRIVFFNGGHYDKLEEWKEAAPVNRLYTTGFNLLLACLANSRDQFRGIDIRAPLSAPSVTFGFQTENASKLSPFSHGHIFSNLFAFPTSTGVKIWDLRKHESCLASVDDLGGVLQAYLESNTTLALLRSQHLTMLNF